MIKFYMELYESAALSHETMANYLYEKDFNCHSFFSVAKVHSDGAAPFLKYMDVPNFHTFLHNMWDIEVLDKRNIKVE